MSRRKHRGIIPRTFANQKMKRPAWKKSLLMPQMKRYTTKEKPCFSVSYIYRKYSGGNHWEGNKQ